MKIGLALATYCYNDSRIPIATRSLESLSRTNPVPKDKTILKISYRPSNLVYVPYVEKLNARFIVELATDPPYMNEAWIIHQDLGMRLLNEHPDVTHVCFLCDDWIYNPGWLQELYMLIERHPDNCRAWSVYRSAYTEYHRIVGGDDRDVLMTMHDGIGCVTREEWQDFCRDGYHGAPDIQHAAQRPGNRWATSRDFIQQIGGHPGIEHVDCAIDFVGEEIC